MYANHNIAAWKLVLVQAKRFTHPAPDAVAPNRMSNRLLRDDQAEPCKAKAVVERYHFQLPETAAPTPSERLLKLTRRQQPLVARESKRRGRLPAALAERTQTLLMRCRPLARRAFNTLRPPTVRMRALKPCVRARCKLLGW